ncbi:MAG TPA: metalloregulator ArsR/SmtB family transcription factor [Candidatus Lustribacter sp.]|nr:metalloregulator ArsR/SmtB family transcription factor [Candidatus Lustribacter sp.]
MGVVFIQDAVFTQDAALSDGPAPGGGLESRTRERVLHAISSLGPVTAAALGTRLGLTATAVRRHIDNLVEAGLIAEHEMVNIRRGRGRPARSYVMSDSGHRALGSDYDHLAVDALRFLADTAGPEAVATFAQRRLASTEARYGAQLASVGADPAARAQALVGLLNADGFAASARPVAGGASPLTGVQICQGHCPVQHVAAEFPQLCDAETESFSRLLGVHVQRLATLAHGEHVCTTFVPTSASGATSAAAPNERPSR